ncbi:MAG: Hsp33 family molecular chaperone HslO [Balneolaceae bacterium]
MSLKEKFKFKDRLIKGISPEGHFKISVVKSTDLVRSAKKRHQLSLLNTVLLGRTLTASMLLAAELKGEERIRIQLDGSGPVAMIRAEANRAGEVRGYVRNPLAELDYPSESIGDGIGTGLLTVSKTLYNEAQPRTSTIQIVKGDITSDLAHYLAQSEQIPSAVMIDLQLDDDGSVIHSGGVLLQRLPDADDAVMDNLQTKLKSFPVISGLLAQNHYIDDIMRLVTNPYKVRELDRQPVHFFCRCNRNRIINALSLLSYSDLKEMEGETQEIICHYCNNRITIESDQIHELVLHAQARMN